ncbi:MAPEG family protein [Kordiimonas marina]|uniref:MAPEG family protein n=1 Tax=Kordiimonas marina TaxID=2872312 RepID=UPI001FF24981|nr:MAPEG family protein [Kordiimonas marina]MCJ9428447.1 MAPEG family protein [Kordiimonas marina]
MTITLITASFIGLLLIYLSYNVTKHRGRTKTSIGDGGDEGLTYAIRAQGNLVEYAPVALILLGLLESMGANRPLLIVLGATFVVARCMHGLTLGKIDDPNLFRFWGTVLTGVVILVESVMGLLVGYHLV